MTEHMEKATAAAENLEDNVTLTHPEDIMLFGALHALIDIAESLRNSTIRPMRVNFQGQTL